MTLEKPYDRYVDWMKRVVSSSRHNGTLQEKKPINQQSSNSNSSLTDPVLKTIHQIGDNLPSILHGKTDPLETLFGTKNQAEPFYRHIWDGSAKKKKKIAHYLQILTHTKTHISAFSKSEPEPAASLAPS